jgi:hypothetical protein
MSHDCNANIQFVIPNAYCSVTTTQASERVAVQCKEHDSLYKLHYMWYEVYIISYDEGVAQLYRNSMSLWCLKATKIESGVIYKENPNNF